MGHSFVHSLVLNKNITIKIVHNTDIYTSHIIACEAAYSVHSVANKPGCKSTTINGIKMSTGMALPVFRKLHCKTLGVQIGNICSQKSIHCLFNSMMIVVNVLKSISYMKCRHIHFCTTITRSLTSLLPKNRIPKTFLY